MKPKRALEANLSPGEDPHSHPHPPPQSQSLAGRSATERVPRAVLHVCAGNLRGGIETFLLGLARRPPPTAVERQAFAVIRDGWLRQSLDAAAAEVFPIGPLRLGRPWTIPQTGRRLLDALRSPGPGSGRPFNRVVFHGLWPFALLSSFAREARAWGELPAELALVLWMHDHFGKGHWTEALAQLRGGWPDVIVCNSLGTAGTLARSRWKDAVPIQVIRCPVDPLPREWFLDPHRQDVRRRLRTPDAAVVIAIAARFDSWKGHSLLLEALIRLKRERPGLPSWCLWVLGAAQRPFEEALLKDWKEQARRGGLIEGEDLRFLGLRDDVAAVLAAADVYCQPNTAAEPFGLAFVEALAAGLPVLTTSQGGAEREILTSACGALVTPGDGAVAALAAVLGDWIADPSTRRALGRAGPDRARDLCDPAAFFVP